MSDILAAALGAGLVAGILVLFNHGIEKLNLWWIRLVEKRKVQMKRERQ